MVTGTAPSIRLYGRLLIEGEIEALTGLHIGAGRGDLVIGGMENPVVRDPLTDRPYIPGSSLKGKLRSLLEKREGRPLNQRIHQSRIHICLDPAAYATCPVCRIFGIPGQYDHSEPTRLVVRDVPLTEESARRLGEADLEGLYTEVKWEVAIDRITSAASPRQTERVPAGAVFGPAQLVYSIYEPADVDRLATLLETLQLLEDDYLGGLGSRGSGRIAFRHLRVALRSAPTYAERQLFRPEPFARLDDLLAQTPALLSWVRQTLGLTR